MKRFSRASTLGGLPVGPSLRAGSARVRDSDDGDDARGCCRADRAALARCHGGTSPRSATCLDRDAALPSEPPSCPDDPPDPLALPVVSPARGYPGWFGELTYGSFTSSRRRLLTNVGVDLVRAIAFLSVARNSNQCVALAKVHQPNALRLPPGLSDLASRRPDDTAARGDGVQLCVVIDDQRSDQTATALVVLNRQHPFATAALHRVLLDRSALRIATGRR